MRSFRPAPIVAAIVSLLALLSGCMSGSHDDNVAVHAVAALESFGDATQQELSFTTSAGTAIHATVYLPTKPFATTPSDVAHATRFGTIVNFSPYYTNLYGIDTDGRLASVRSGARHLNQTGVGLLLAHGFAYVAASVPGTGRSGGCFSMGGLQEQTDMAQFIDWVGEQSWSNGKVGMTGGSYDGTTQWMAAIHHPKHLVTIVPHVSITDFYDYEYQNGAPYAWWGPYFEPYYNLLVGLGVDPLAVPPLANPQTDTLPQDLCPGLAQHFTQAETTYETGVYDAFWQERDYEAGMPNITASVLLVHGLQDWNVKPLNLDVWDSIHTEKRFWLQQMQHNAPFRDTYNRDFKRDDWNTTLLAWYDHYLNGAENGIPQALPDVTVQDHQGLWRSESQWPPASVQATTLYLGQASLSSAQPAAGQTTFSTVPGYTGVFLEPTVGVKGPDAPDAVVAKFTSEPLTAPMRIAGVPRLLANLSVDRPGYAHLVVELWRVHANGTWEFLDMGGRGLAQRNGRTMDEQVLPLTTMEVPVELNPTESFLAAGDRLGLTLAGDDPDWFHSNGNTPTWFVDHGSRLVLPLLPADAPKGMSSDETELANPYYMADAKQF